MNENNTQNERGGREQKKGIWYIFDAMKTTTETTTTSEKEEEEEEEEEDVGDGDGGGGFAAALLGVEVNTKKTKK